MATAEPVSVQKKPPPHRALAAATCCAVMFLYAVYLGSFSVLLPHIATEFRLGSAASGRLFPASFLGFAAGVLVCGYLSDRWGRKAVLLLGIAVYGAGLFLVGCAPAFSLVLLATALIGIGSGAMETVASALASDLFPERRAFILNALQVAFGAGASASPALAHHLLTTTGTDWRALYMGLAAACAAVALALVVQRLPRDDSSSESEAMDFAVLRRVFFRERAFAALCLTQALYVGAEVGFFSWMPTYFSERLPGGTAYAGMVATVFWLAMLVGRVAVVALLSGRGMPITRMVFLFAAGGAVGSTLALVWSSPLVVMAFVAWTGLCFSGIFALVLAEAGERYPRYAGTAFGGVIAMGGIGGAAIPWAVGALADTPLVGWQGALALVPLSSLGVAAVMLRLRQR